MVDQPMSQRAGGLGRFAARAGWVTACVLALGVGVALIVLGAATYTGAHAVQPVEIDGHVANYTEILIGNTYAHNDLRLAGDSHTYVLDSRQFHPSLPERFSQDARITIWVDRGTSNVVALTLYDVMGLNPVTYTTPSYSDPTATLQAAQTQGSAMAGAGLVLVVLVPLGWFVVRLRRRGGKRPRGEAVSAARRGAAPLEPQPAPLPFSQTAAAATDSARWPPGARASELSHQGAQTTSPPAASPQASAPSRPSQRVSTGWPPAAGEAGAVPGWDIGDLPTHKTRAQQVPGSTPPAVDEVPTQKTRAQSPADQENPPKAAH